MDHESSVLRHFFCRLLRFRGFALRAMTVLDDKEVLEFRLRAGTFVTLFNEYFFAFDPFNVYF